MATGESTFGGNGTDLIGEYASGVINVPAGNISSTNVQDAINELDTEKISASDIRIVHTTGNETISGSKSFTSAINIPITGTPTTLTNPTLQTTNSINSFTQVSIQNKSAGTSSSSDHIAYPDNNTNDTTGFIDIGITSSGFSDAAYAITTPNDAYVFGSAVSGAGKLGNLVIATDSTGSSNNIVFGIGGFTSLNKERMRLTASLLSLGYQSIASGVIKLWNSANAFATTIQQPSIAADTTITLPNATSTLATTGLVETLTNKRITKRVTSLSANSATPAINTDLYDVCHITAQTATITGFTMTGTPVDGDTLRISITGTATVPFTLGSSFEASGGVPLSTTTSGTARLDMGFFWNTETSKWRQVAAS